MDASLIESVLELLERLFGQAPGSPEFYLAFGISTAAWVIAARLFMVVVSTSRGIIAASLACLVSLTAGLLGFASTELYVLPKFEADWAARVLPLTGLFVFILVSVLVVTKRILKLSAGGTIFIYIVATMVAVCVHFGVQIVTGLMDAGGGQVEQRERRLQEEFESVY